MRVLLISPIRGVDPPNGDVTYTEELLATPPPGVDYETYPQALAAGRIVEQRRRHGPRQGPGDWLRLGAATLENRARRAGLLFREPFRYFAVQPGAYDLIHTHVFSVRIDPGGTPLLVSNACPIEVVYRDLRGWSPRRLGFFRAADRWLATRGGVVHSSYGAHRADRVVAFSEHLRDWYVGAGKVPPDRVDVVPNFVRKPESVRTARERPTVIGFIAQDFVAKGGPQLLQAFRDLQRVRPECRLVVVGASSRPAELPADVEWLGRVARDRLLSEVLPAFDVFVYPTRFDGLPFVVLEALATGLPVITSDYDALPEVVGDGGVVVPQGDVRSLVDAIDRVLDPTTNRILSAHARARFEQRYEAGTASRALGDSYARAIAHGDRV